MQINSVKHTNLKAASVLAARHLISTDVSSFFPLSVCFLLSSGLQGGNHQTLSGGFLRRSTGSLLSVWLPFAIDHHPPFAFFPGPHHTVLHTQPLLTALG